MTILERLIPEQLRGSTKARSLEDFLGIGEKNGISFVFATVRSDHGRTFTQKVEYYAVYWSSLGNRNLVFSQKLPFTSKKTSTECLRRGLLKVIDGLELVESKLPKVEVAVIDPSLKVFYQKADFQEVRQNLEAQVSTSAS